MTILINVFTDLISVTEQEIPFTRGPNSFDGGQTESIHP